MRSVIVISFILAILPLQGYAFVDLKQTYPRLANYFLKWTISDSEASELAKWDLLILDAETAYRSPQAIAAIRQLNPDVVILAYLPAAEIRADWPHLKEIAPIRHRLGSLIPAEWYLKDAAGQRRSFWSGTWILNATDKCPQVNGWRWNQFLPEFAVNEILKNNLWDGVFYDNGWDNITYFAGVSPDLDNDGQAEAAKTADKLWQEGIKKIYQETRRLAPGKLIFENDGPIYAPDVDGVMLENFSQDKNWQGFAANLRKIKEQSQKAAPILNANTQNTGWKSDYSAVRFGLATSLFFDGFYSFDYGDQDHGQTWWYDEYDVYLGQPAGQAKRLSDIGLWRRDFQNGVVFLNSASELKNLKFEEEFEKLRGTQDRSVNDGLIVSEFGLSPSDGIILRRPLKEIIGAVYLNGVFVRVFDQDGKISRTGFFAYDAKYPNRTRLASLDLNGDSQPEFISASQGVLRIRDGQQTVLITPFGKRQGEINFALGDVNNDGLNEVAIAASREGDGEVRVYRPNGDLLSLPWRAFGQQYQGGVNLAIGDLNNDGFSEIIVGPAQGGPQVRIFSFEGRLLSGGFFAYDPRFRGGVRVAAGDINNDGRAEILTGPGPGGTPQIKIFSAQGKSASGGNGAGFRLVGSFFAFNETSRAGVQPLVADLDQDGKMEILATTGEVF